MPPFLGGVELESAPGVFFFPRKNSDPRVHDRALFGQAEPHLGRPSPTSAQPPPKNRRRRGVGFHPGYFLKKNPQKKKRIPKGKLVGHIDRQKETGEEKRSRGMAVSDKVLGAVLIALAGFIFVYYSVWVLILVRRGARLLFRTLRWNKPAQPLSRPACPPPLHPRFPAVCRRFRHLN